MNRFSFLLILTACLLSSYSLLVAQTPNADVLYRLDRSTIRAKVSEVTATEVFYTDLTSLHTPRKISKANLWKVVFADGTSDVFNALKSGPDTLVRSAQNSSEPPVPGARASVRPVSSASSGYSGGARSIIKYAPLSNFGYEHVLPNNHSLYVGISIYGLGAGYSALGFKGEYRFYGLIKISPKQAPEGFWVAPTVQVWRLSVRDSYYGVSESFCVSQLGGIAGYQWVFNNRITLEPALGLAVGVLGTDADYGLAATALPLFAVRVGYVLK